MNRVWLGNEDFLNVLALAGLIGRRTFADTTQTGLSSDALPPTESPSDIGDAIGDPSLPLDPTFPGSEDQAGGQADTSAPPTFIPEFLTALGLGTATDLPGSDTTGPAPQEALSEEVSLPGSAPFLGHTIPDTPITPETASTDDDPIEGLFLFSPETVVAFILSKASVILALAEKYGLSPEEAIVQTMMALDFASDRLIIRWDDDISTGGDKTVLDAMGATVTDSLGKIGVDFLTLDGDGASVAETVLKYLDDPRISYIEPDYEITIETITGQAVTPDDARYGSLWGLNNTGQSGGTPDADIDAAEAWEITTGSSSVVVGVIDTGVDYTHPDLDANMWVNPGEIAGNGIDDDGNGFVDDIHGYDFVNNDGDPMDDNDHGTHVAGTIAAEGNNGTGVTGVGWNTSIMALKFLSASGSGSTSAAIQAVNYATLMGADITNNSWGGGGFSQGLQDAIAAADAAGSLFVAAAGNDGTNNDVSPHYPSNYTNDNVISVASTTRNDQLSSFSNYGVTSVDLAAPGSSILSTVTGGGYASFSGTSMATPHVAGAAALLLAQDPSLSDEELRDILLSSVDPVSSLDGRVATGGRLNANTALQDINFTGEVGTIADLTHVPQTIQFQQSYTNPIVFLQAPSHNGADPAYTRIQSVSGDQFTVALDEPDYRDGNHAPETVSYFVIEAGTYQLPGGGMIQAGSVDSNLLSTGGFTSVTFDAAFDHTPVVLSQIQSNNDSAFVVTRQNNVSTTGVDITMQEQQSDNSGSHGTENVGWLAVTPGVGNWGDVLFEAARSERTVNHDWKKIDFAGDYATAPLFIGGLSSFVGADPAWLRYNGLSSDGVQVKAQEGQSQDQEVSHAPEIVDFLAFSGTGVFRASPSTAGTGSIAGTLWYDADADGVRDEGEGVIANRRVFIDSNNNGAYDLGERNVVTGTDGSYAFGEIAAGNHTIAYDLKTGETATSPANPSAYTARTSLQSNGPAYSWTDISAIGTALSLGDDSSTIVSLPFDFLFYGDVQSSVRISSNGYLTFGTDGTDWSNDPIPSGNDPDALIAPFWDDLNPARGGDVYHYHDAANDRFIVQYDAVARYSGAGTYTFQAILNADNSIEYHYNDMNGTLSSATVGIENAQGTDGIQIAYNTAAIQDTMAISFSTDPSPSTAVTLNANQNLTNIDFGLDSGGGHGEVGQITNLTHEVMTIELSHYYENPVVFVQPPSHNGAQPATTRIVSVDNDQFSVAIQEPNHLDGAHVPETVSYFVFEAGEWQLTDGTVLQVGTLDSGRLTTRGFDSVTFNQAFSETPVILSQVQSQNGGDFVVTRQTNASTTGFDVAMQEEQDLMRSGHMVESIGWMALTPGAGMWDGIQYEAQHTGASVTHNWAAIDFATAFAEAPMFLGGIASANGMDPGWARHNELTADGVNVRVVEDTSADSETAHVAEVVDFLALSGSGLLTADELV